MKIPDKTHKIEMIANNPNPKKPLGDVLIGGLILAKPPLPIKRDLICRCNFFKASSKSGGCCLLPQGSLFPESFQPM